MVLFAVVSALISHQVYKRHEPSLRGAAVIFLVGQATLFSWSISSGLSFFVAIRETVYQTFIHLLVLTTSIFAYRLFWHPLQSFPGPRLARLSKLSAVPTAFRGDMHHYLQQLHQQYGDFVRIGPNELSIRNAGAVVPIYGPTGWDKGATYTVLHHLKQGEPGLQSILSHAPHARRRKIWDAAFTTSALVTYQDQVRDRTAQLIDAIGDRSGTLVDMRLFFQLFTADIMFDLTFGGHGPQLVKAGKDVIGMYEAMLSYLKVVMTMGNIPYLTPLLKLLPSDPKVKKFIDFCSECYSARVQDPLPSNDIFRHLIADVSPARTSDNDKKLLAQARADTSLLIVGGSDTVTSTLSNLLYLLLTEPDLKSFRRLQLEIDRAHEDKDDLDWNEIGQRVPFLDYCLNETMRLFPAGFVGPFQRVAPAGGGFVCDRFIPGGTHVAIPHYVLQRDPRYFSNPDQFMPERWAPGQKEKINKTAFIPFSYGPYSCIGKQLAYMELRLVMTAILREFDARVPDDFDPKKFEASFKAFVSLEIMETLPVIFTRRQPKTTS